MEEPLLNIDYLRTARKVKSFFNDEVPRLQRACGLQIKHDLQSPVLDDMPKSPNFSNHLEERLVRDLDELDYYILARLILNKVVLSVHLCDYISQQIIIGVHFKNFTSVKMQRQIGYGTTQYYHLKNDAYNQFADYFYNQMHELKRRYPYSDLHVYK